MSLPRKYALIAGVFYLLTFVSVPTLSLYSSVLQPNFIVGSGPDTPVIAGVLLEMVVALAGIGTTVALYPVVRKQGEARAIGFIAMRVLEAATIYVGIVSLMSIVMLRRAGVGPSAQAIGQGLAALYQQTFFFAQSLIPAINGVLLGSLLYQSRLVPRWLPLLAFAGAVLLAGTWIAVLSGFVGMRNPSTALGAVPIAAWEFSLGVYLTFRGFKPSPVTAAM